MQVGNPPCGDMPPIGVNHTPFSLLRGWAGILCRLVALGFLFLFEIIFILIIHIQIIYFQFYFDNKLLVHLLVS